MDNYTPNPFMTQPAHLPPLVLGTLLKIQHLGNSKWTGLRPCEKSCSYYHLIALFWWVNFETILTGLN